MAASTITEATGERVFVVGDIHGCVDETRTLVNYLLSTQGISDRDVLIFLGDYIDRGPDSRGVIDYMLEVKTQHPKTRFLKGNHEDMLLDFLGFGGKLGQAFLYNGGLETIQSYGISVFASPEEMVGGLPPAHFQFLNSLESVIRVDGFLCVHAGLNPLRDLTAQNDSDVFWIRDEFIANVHHFGNPIVFGHTPHQEILFHLPYKIGIDTGLVFGNKLTCLELKSGKVFQLKRGAKEVVESEAPAGFPRG